MLTSPDGTQLGVKILDFGLSKLARGDDDVTRANYFAGSVMYFAPELMKNKGIDARADVYSLGCSASVRSAPSARATTTTPSRSRQRPCPWRRSRGI